MLEPQASPGRSWSRPGMLMLAGAVALGAVVWLSMRGDVALPLVQASLTPVAPATIATDRQPVGVPGAPASAPVLPKAAAIDSPAANAVPAKPSFDIVRVTPSGEAVMAGRASPGAEVVVAGNTGEIGRTQADARGQWVLVPTQALPAGGQELKLSSRIANGERIASDAPVLVLIPDTPTADLNAKGPQVAASRAGPMVVLLPPNAPPRLLQATPEPAPPGSSSRPGLDIVDYDDLGSIRFAGSGTPGGAIRIYIDNAPMGDAAVDAKGRWSLVPSGSVTVGDHRLRVDQLTSTGQASARAEFPFQRARLSAQDVAGERIVVQPRQNLWRIARRAYGLGVHYTVIYEANKDQIRSPDLIYPGQLFTIPTQAH